MTTLLGENMSYITLRCKNCGSDLSINHDSKTINCLHCGSTFLMVDLLDERDIAFSNSIKPEDLEAKMQFAEALKQGETYLYQAEYKLAEQAYKRAIEINNKNYKGYFGVVRAKTSNLNRIPDEKDYQEYLKLAIKYVDKDDRVYLESECVKLEMLINEKEKQKRRKFELEQKQLRQEKNARDTETFFGYITIFLILFISGILMLVIVMTGLSSPTQPNNTTNSYEVSSKAELTNALSQQNMLSSTIVLTADIDFGDALWTPIGSSEHPFTGKIYGNGHTLSNITITPVSGEGVVYGGLIAYAKNATINGIFLKNITYSEAITATHETTTNFGLLCGFAEDCQISKCQIENSCSITLANKDKNRLKVGGLVGLVKNSQISYCYSNAKINATVSNISTSVQNSAVDYHIGGLAGVMEASKISNSYSGSNININLSTTNTQNIHAFVGGLVGLWNIGTAYEDKISTSMFSGKIDVNFETSTKNLLYIGGIAGSGAKSSCMQSNFSVHDQNTYVLNNNNMSLTAISGEAYFVSTIILEYIEQYFLAETWTNTTTLTPTLGAA